ncbi:MAG: hypothetical protein BZ138_06275, partial [Methanosphaera sp. rholeuAM270]
QLFLVKGLVERADDDVVCGGVEVHAHDARERVELIWRHAISCRGEKGADLGCVATKEARRHL